VKVYAADNEMKINNKKTKFMLFNNSKLIDFMPSFLLNDVEIKLVEEMKVLGIVLSSDMKWDANTNQIIATAYKRLWILKRLKSLGTGLAELTDVYKQQIRSVLEFAVPVWHSGLTQCNRYDIERVQKSALHILLGESYDTYSNAIKAIGLESLEARRGKLCLKFAMKSAKHPKHNKWFKINKKSTVTRQIQPKFCPVVSRTKRFSNSPISYLTNILNLKNSKVKAKQ